MIAEQPFIERDFGALEHGANSNGELLAAVVALIEPVAVLLPLRGGRIDRAAVRALGTVRPTKRLKVFTGGYGVGGGGEMDPETSSG
jgi:hypothetical protein